MPDCSSKVGEELACQRCGRMYTNRDAERRTIPEATREAFERVGEMLAYPAKAAKALEAKARRWGVLMSYRNGFPQCAQFFGPWTARMARTIASRAPPPSMANMTNTISTSATPTPPRKSRIGAIVACSPKTVPCGMRDPSALVGKETLDERQEAQAGRHPAFSGR
jgi:hypothetical protein